MDPFNRREQAPDPRYVQTDVGRLIRNVATVRLVLYLFALVMLLCVGIPLAVFLVWVIATGSSGGGGFAPLAPTPVVRPTPPRSPGGLLPPGVVVLLASAPSQAPWRASDGQGPAPAGAPCAREGKIKGCAQHRTSPHGQWLQRYPNGPRGVGRVWAQGRRLCCPGAASTLAQRPRSWLGSGAGGEGP